MNTTHGHPQPHLVAVDVADPDLDADVRAVLAALALQARSRDGGPVDVLVTDRVGPAAPGGPARVVPVAADGAGFDDDEVVRLPSGTARLVELLSAPVEGAGSLVTVVGAVGGCGTSTVAAALAVRAAGHGRVLLVETDPRGRGVDLLLGVESAPGLRVQDVRSALGGPDPEALWASTVPVLPGCGVLARARSGVDARGRDQGRGGGDEAPRAVDPPAGAGALGAALAHRGAGGLVVCDGGAFDAADPLPGRADLVVVVTRSDLAGAVAAADVVAALAGDTARGTAGTAAGVGTAAARVHLVVRTHRGDPLHAADVAGSAGLQRWDVLPEMRSVRGLAGAGELGTSLARGRTGRLRRLATVADAVLERGGLR